jgi:hypothetical protein
MANAALASGPGPVGPDTISQNVADKLLATPAQATLLQAPRVTLTIELGSLSPDSIGAIANFVRDALSANPAVAVGSASLNPVAASVSNGAKPND